MVNTDTAAQNVPLGSKTLYISGEVAIADLFTLTGTGGAIHLLGNTGTQNIEFGSTAIPHDLIINCAGATKEFQDNYTFASLTGVAGDMDGQSKRFTLNGDLNITNIDILNAFFTINADANIQNNNATNYIELTVAAGKTATKVGDFYCVECNIEANATLTGSSYLRILPWISNFLNIAAGGSISVGVVEITLVLISRSNGAVSLDTNLTLNAGGAAVLTMTGALTCKFFTVSGKFIDGGNVINTDGFSIANTASLVTSTAQWKVKANGNISNPNSTNILTDVSVENGITATRNGVVYAKKLTVGTGSTLTGSSIYKIVNPTGNNFITNTGTITGGDIEITLDADRSNGAVTFDTDLILKASADKRLTWTGHVIANDFEIEANAKMTLETASFADSINNGDITINQSEQVFVNDISGNGIFRSNDANIKTVWVRGSNNFTGTLINVILEEYPPSSAHKIYYGNTLTKGMRLELV
jgi:hypothetical protein